MIDAKSAAILLLILLVLGVILLVADGIIFVRWLRYLWTNDRVEETDVVRFEAENGSQPATFADAEAGSAALPGAAELADAPAGAEALLGAVHSGADAGAEPAAMPGAAWQDAGTAEPQPTARSGADAVPYPFARTWSLVDPFLGFQFVFIVSQVVIGLAMLPLLIGGGASNGMQALLTPMGIIIQCLGLFLMNGLFVGVTAFYVHRYRMTLGQIGLGRPTARQVGLGIGLGLGLFVLASAAEVGLGAALPHLLPKAVMNGLTEFTKAVTAGGMFAGIPSVQLKIFFALAGAVAAPIGEEVFFRGLLYNSLKQKLNVRAAIVISGFIFALVHFGPLAILIIFPMGMLLAYVYERTGSLWVTICMHGVHNGLSFLIAMVAPQFGEAPKPPVKPVPNARPAIVAAVCPPARNYARPPLRGAVLHGQG